MSIAIIIGLAAIAEGTAETAAKCIERARDIIKHKRFKHRQRRERKRRARNKFA